MKKALLISVAAIGLIGGANMALSQGSAGGAAGGGAGAVGGAGGAAGGGTGGVGSGSSTQANPSGPSGGASGADRAGTSGPSASSPSAEQSPGARKGAQQDRIAPRNQKSSQQGTESPGDRQGQTGTQRQSESPAATGSKQGANERPMTSKNVSLTTEQKTTIRKTVLTGSAPRLSGRADFDIKVGVVVPREVRVAPLPRTIVEIEPEWRGFMYFISGDEIIVVEPQSLRIVAVLDV